MIIEINAIDTLFFRDSKPFSMGEETWADGLFPPYPSVIYGALRSVYFANHIEELEKANETNDSTENLQIKSINFKVGNDIYFPLPLDCVRDKNGGERDKNKVFPLHIDKLPQNSFTNIPCKSVLTAGNFKVENISDGIVRKSALENYLKLTVDNFSIFEFSDYVIPEPKIGIACSSETHSSEEGKLYRVDMKRLESEKGGKLSVIVDFEGLDLPESGMMKLGGEGKAVSYRKYSDNIEIAYPEFKDDTKCFKLVLTTPAIFKNGWFPERVNKDKELKLKLLTAAIGKPINIGGFDMKRRMPKPMFKAVPAGSVYYFELQEGIIGDVIDIFHGKAISDYHKEQGFGIAYTGKIREE